MDANEAFEHVELEIKSKQDRAEFHKFCAGKHGVNRAYKERHWTIATLLDKEIVALKVVLELAKTASNTQKGV